MNPSALLSICKCLAVASLFGGGTAISSAQIVLQTAAFIENPTGVHYVFSTDSSTQGSGTFTYLNTNNAGFDLITVTVSANGSFQGVSGITQRSVSGLISSSSFSVAYNGTTRAGPTEPTFGATTLRAGDYSGNVVDPSAGVGSLEASVSAGGRVVTYALLGTNVSIGVGTVDSAGNFSLRFNSGVSASGNFTPANGIARGHLALSTGVTQDYNVTKAVPARLGNISTRGFVGTGDQVLIAGFIVIEGSKGVIITAKGPSLANVPNVLRNPRLVVFSGNQAIASNNNWQTDARAVEVAASGLAPTDPREAAIFLSLAPGPYTVQVSSEDAATGIGLVEVYGVGGPLGR